MKIDRSGIKNSINQILENSLEITNEMPSRDNFAKKNPRKVWIACIFIDIVGYTKICKNWPEKEVANLVRTFHEGILKIFKSHSIKNIEIQGDGIFGIVHISQQDSIEANNLFECAMNINGFLNFFLKKRFDFDFKISISLDEELMIIVGKDDERKIVYAGGTINLAKKIIENEKKLVNCILIDPLFYQNNKEILWNSQKNESYVSKIYYNSLDSIIDNPERCYYSKWCFSW